VKKVFYTYDSADRLDYVTDWAGRVTDFQYNAKSQLSKIVFPNGTRRNFTYDNAGRLALLRDETSTLQTICQTQCGYDLLSRLNQDHRSLGRLGEDCLQDSPQGRDERERTSQLATPEPAPYNIVPASMTYDNDDRLATWNAITCSSDLDGNLTTGPLVGAATTFTYDSRNRLTNTSGTNATTYTYDAENRRTSQTVNGTTTTYIHDPQATLSRLLVRTTTNGSITTTTRYIYAAGMLLYEELAGTSPTTKTYHFDTRGSTLALTNDSQTITDRLTYGSYGETISRTGTTNTPFLYHGAYGVETDQNSLCQMRARYYNPETRRFQNADPLGFGGGMNWYGFVGGDPINAIDPMGLWTLGIGGTASGNLYIGGITLDLGVYIGHSKQAGWSFGFLGTYESGMGIGLSASIGGFANLTSAKCVNQLKGPSIDIGGSASAIVLPVTAGISYNGGRDRDKLVNEGKDVFFSQATYHGITINAGVGEGSPEVHAYATGTDGWTW
jgi:RHS repeat-associated protein